MAAPQKNPFEEDGEVDLMGGGGPGMAWRENPFASMRKSQQAAAAPPPDPEEPEEEEEPEVDFGDMYGDAESDVHKSILTGQTEEEAEAAALAALQHQEAAPTTTPLPPAAPTIHQMEASPFESPPPGQLLSPALSVEGQIATPSPVRAAPEPAPAPEQPPPPPVEEPVSPAISIDVVIGAPPEPAPAVTPAPSTAAVAAFDPFSPDPAPALAPPSEVAPLAPPTPVTKAPTAAAETAFPVDTAEVGPALNLTEKLEAENEAPSTPTPAEASGPAAEPEEATDAAADLGLGADAEGKASPTLDLLLPGEFQEAEEEREDPMMDGPMREDSMFSRDSLMSQDEEGMEDLALQESYEASAVRYQYTAQLPGRTLGLQVAEVTPDSVGGGDGSTHRHVVTTLMDFGPAQLAGILEGSIIRSVNKFDTGKMDHEKLLKCLKQQPRPLKLVLENARRVPDLLAGKLYHRKTRGFDCPQKLKYFREVYVVLGGALAPPNVLQFYKSEEEYTKTVKAMQAKKKPPKATVKAYKLDASFRVGMMKPRKYENMYSTTICWFWLKNPKSRSKVVKLASEDPRLLVGLHRQIISRIGPTAHSSK